MKFFNIKNGILPKKGDVLHINTEIRRADGKWILNEHDTCKVVSIYNGGDHVDVKITTNRDNGPAMDVMVISGELSPFKNFG